MVLLRVMPTVIDSDVAMEFNLNVIFLPQGQRKGAFVGQALRYTALCGARGINTVLSRHPGRHLVLRDYPYHNAGRGAALGPSDAQLPRLYGVEGQQPVDDGDAVEEAGHAGAVAAAEDPDTERQCTAVDREDAGAQVVPVRVQW